jgi:RimJ/RimL family protein N-acetyltransferase
MGAKTNYIAETPRLRIRRKLVSDAVDDYRWRRDPEVVHFDGVEPTSVPFSVFMNQFQAELEVVNPERCQFSIENEEGIHIGNIMFYNANRVTGVVELGLAIAERAYRGRGLGQEAVRVFLAYLFEQLGFSVVQLHTLEWNTAARKTFEATGFRATARVVRGSNTLLRMECTRDDALRAGVFVAAGKVSAGGE